MKVICTKTFSSEGCSFLKNMSYELVEYKGQDNFYVGAIPFDKKTPYALFPISNYFRCNFTTLKEQRKNKIEKINETTK